MHEEIRTCSCNSVNRRAPIGAPRTRILRSRMCTESSAVVTMANLFLTDSELLRFLFIGSVTKGIGNITWNNRIFLE